MTRLSIIKITQNRHLLAQLGFTLIELMIVVAIISTLGAIAIPVYHDNIVKTQAYRLAYGLKNSITTNVQEGTCFASSAISPSTVEGVDKMIGVYGTATITITATGRPPGGIKYVLNSSGVSGQIKGKTIAMTVSKDSVLAKDSATTVDNKYLAQAIK